MHAQFCQIHAQFCQMHASVLITFAFETVFVYLFPFFKRCLFVFVYGVLVSVSYFCLFVVFGGCVVL